MLTWTLLLNEALALSWTVGTPAFSCYDPDFADPDSSATCPKLGSFCGAIDPIDGRLFIAWESYHDTAESVWRKVQLRRFDGSWSSTITLTSEILDDGDREEFHSPSCEFVASSSTNRWFLVTTRTIGDGGRHLLENWIDPSDLSIDRSVPIDGDGSTLCRECDQGTNKLHYNPVAGKVGDWFVHQMPDGAAFEDFDDTFANCRDVSATSWSPSNLEQVAGGRVATCDDLEALDTAAPEPDACAAEDHAFPDKAQHHSHVDHRADGTWWQVFSDWLPAPRDVRVGMASVLSSFSNLSLFSHPTGYTNTHTAEPVVAVDAQDDLLVAWKQQYHHTMGVAWDKFTAVMLRSCADTNLNCSTSFSSWVPNATNDWATAVYATEDSVNNR